MSWKRKCWEMRGGKTCFYKRKRLTQKLYGGRSHRSENIVIVVQVNPGILFSTHPLPQVTSQVIKVIEHGPICKDHV
jgi:hypothetical protein